MAPKILSSTCTACKVPCWIEKFAFLRCVSIKLCVGKLLVVQLSIITYNSSCLQKAHNQKYSIFTSYLLIHSFIRLVYRVLFNH